MKKEYYYCEEEEAKVTQLAHRPLLPLEMTEDENKQKKNGIVKNLRMKSVDLIKRRKGGVSKDWVRKI